MIRLNDNFKTVSTDVFNGATTTKTTDTLRISYVELGFESGSVTAFIQKGTVVDGVFTENMPKIRVDIASDGSFRSNDGNWSGKIGRASCRERVWTVV